LTQLGHDAVSTNLAKLDIPDQIHNWILHHLNNRTHSTRLGKEISTSLPINASVIQGSAIGPFAFTVALSSLRPIFPGDDLNKYADDITLLIPSTNDDTVETELQNIELFLTERNLKLNRTKSSEMIVCSKQHAKSKLPTALPPLIPGITRYTQIKILGVTMANDLSFHHHLMETLSSCQQSLYGIKVLKNHGLAPPGLHTVFHSTVMSKIMYASQAWYGFLQKADGEKVEGFLRRCFRLGYCSPDDTSFTESCGSADRALFKSIRTNVNHVLYSLLPLVHDSGHNLRPRTSGVVVNLDLGERCHSVLLSGESAAKTGENFENTCELHRNCTPPLVASSEKTSMSLRKFIRIVPPPSRSKQKTCLLLTNFFTIAPPPRGPRKKIVAGYSFGGTL
jgi:hypothetical protein